MASLREGRFDCLNVTLRFCSRAVYRRALCRTIVPTAGLNSVGLVDPYVLIAVGQTATSDSCTFMPRTLRSFDTKSLHKK
jgi:hypothetical protein